MFQPVVQGHQDRSQADHKSQVLPGFSLGEFINILLKDQEDKLKEHQENKKADCSYHPGRYLEHAENHQ